MALTDRRVAQLGRLYDEAHKAFKAAEQRKADITQKVLAEYTRRGTRVVDSNGVKVSKASQERTVYVWAKLAEQLTARQLRSIQKEEVDTTKLAEQMQAGKIDPSVIAACTEVHETRPYLSVIIKRQ